MRVTEPFSPHAVRPPRLGGRYLVSKLLGKGAQARVFLAFDTRLRQWRAVKVLAPQYLEDDHVRARFDQEARAMARLSHPSLLRVVDIDHDGRIPFMVMELARGGAVTDWIKRHGPVPPVLACRAAQQCCNGLAHAHAAGVVHRDVKPHNLLIREDGSVVLTDFGIARLEEDAQLTATGTIMGTFAFMAPEQRTDAKSVDLRADVYSLGATLYTMLTGRTSPELFFAESRDALLEGIPEVLRPIILTACRYEREHRFATMADFHAALERKIAKLPKDPGNPHFATALLPLPEAPPEWLEPDMGVEELRRTLMESEEPTTVVPGIRPSEGPAAAGGQGTSGYTSHPPASTGPYTMPGLRPRSPSSQPPAASVATPGGYSGVMSATVSWSDLPEYLDPGTVDTQSVPSPEPKLSPTPLRASPSSRLEEEPSQWGALPVSRATVLGLVALLLVTLLAVSAAGGLAAKAWTSRQADLAGRELVLLANEEWGVLKALVAAGADEARLKERWTQFQEASPERQAAEASAFVDAVELEAARVGIEGLPLSHVTQLVRARAEWQSAVQSREWARNSLPGRLTGSLGLW